ncbi:hypothetical protein T01_13921 [Trichinella spiralis]|uniref:Uncharacterized protein n=1 Tax=Trichinella spiralis TaxID=6334 RepID=A0A0V1BU05_TRISP|nr:hypothetical protein T01_13921 [Trichinella spiralis]
MALNSAIQPYAFDGLARFSWRLHSQLNINLNGIIVKSYELRDLISEYYALSFINSKLCS